MGSNPKLKEEVARFREWTQTYPTEEHFGEWECDYPDWEPLYRAVLDFVGSIPPAYWTPEEWDGVLYAIARDNEDGYLAESIGEQHPQIIAPLAAAALEQGEAQARWQFAVELGKSGQLSAPVESLLLRMAGDADEYVRRRALMELARLQSPLTEELALAAWQQPHENQQWARMAALWSLNRIHSPLLERLMIEAEADDRSYLSAYALQLRRGEMEE